MMDQKLIDAHVLADYQRREDIRRAWECYADRWPESLARRGDGVDPDNVDNTTVNVVKRVTDKTAHFLFGKGFDVAVDEDGESPADLHVKGFLAQAGGKTYWLDLAKSGAVAGDAFVMFSAPERGQKYPRIRSLDPASVTVVTDPLDWERVTAYIVSARVNNVHSGKTDEYQMVVEQDQDTGRWSITEQVKEGTYRSNAGYRITREAVEWPWGWCPIQHCKNLPQPHCAYGQADLTPSLINLNQKINFYWSNLSRILRIQGHAKGFATGVPDTFEWDMSPDSVLNFESEHAKVGFVQADLETAEHRAIIKEATAALLDEASVPPIAFGRVEDMGSLTSGRALEILYQALIDLTDVKRCLYGDLIERVAKCALDMGGYGYEHEVSVNWPSMIDRGSSMTREDVEAAIGKTTLGISKSTILAEYGYDAEQEAEKVAQEGSALGSALIDAFNSGAGE